MNPLLASSNAATTAVSSTTTSTAVDEAATQFSALPQAIIESHILTHLDGPSLASATCSSATLHRLCSDFHLWSRVCHATWPSTEAPQINDVIRQCGPCAFFAQSFPLPVLEQATSVSSSHRNRLSSSPEVLISAVDIFYKDELIFSKIQETETVTGWFRCSPFSIDLLEPKDVVPTRINYPDKEDTCSIVAADMKLSWIIVDPKGRRAVNLSSHRPVSVQRHWLSGEMQIRFSSILAGAGKKSLHVQCGIVVTCGRSDGGEMQLREVSLQMEDMDGIHLTGKDILVIIQKALEGKRGNAVNREDEARRRYVKYLEMKEERKERKRRAEMVLDTMCITVGICCFVAFCGFLCWKSPLLS